MLQEQQERAELGQRIITSSFYGEVMAAYNRHEWPEFINWLAGYWGKIWQIDFNKLAADLGFRPDGWYQMRRGKGV